MKAVGRGSDPEHELWGPEYFRWLLVHQLFRSVEGILGVLRGTAILRAFYRLCGATIGKDVQLDTVTLYDLECIHIGDQTIIGRDANFQPARVHAGKLAKQPIRIGSRCFIGPNSSLLGGADIPDGTNIRPLSAINSSVPSSAADPSGVPRISSKFLTLSSRTAGYLVVGYVTTMAVAIGMLFVQYAVETVGATVPSIANLLLGQTAAPVPLSFFVAVALAIYFVMPASYFALVAACKRLLLGNLSPQKTVGELGVHLTWSHWVYSKLAIYPSLRCICT